MRLERLLISPQMLYQITDYAGLFLTPDSLFARVFWEVECFNQK
jgi:hypothetical protein